MQFIIELSILISINNRSIINVFSIGKRFDAKQVIYHCTIASEQSYAWNGDVENARLDDDIKEILWKGEILSKDNSLYLPVKSQESHWGILSISLNFRCKKSTKRLSITI